MFFYNGGDFPLTSSSALILSKQFLTLTQMFEHFSFSLRYLEVLAGTGPHNVGVSGFTIVRETPLNLIHIHTLATSQFKRGHTIDFY